MEEYWLEAYNLNPNSHLCISIPLCGSWSQVIGTIWQAKEPNDLMLPSWFDKLDIKDKNKKKVLIGFKYNEEEKGYRPIKKPDWQC